MEDQLGNVTTIDEYIATFPADIQRILDGLRAAIRAAAPDATEKMSYRMPTFAQHGNLVHFAVHQQHIGFYPAPSAIETFRDELAAYKSSKGAIQFPLGRPLPLDLIRRMVQFRVAENQRRAGLRSHPTLRGRPYAAADLPAIQALWPACRPAAWQTDFPSPVDLAELLAAPEAIGRAQVWVDTAGRATAYALIDDYDNLWFDRLPGANDDATGDALVAWGIACARGLAAQRSRPAVLDTACRGEDRARIALLRRRGFVEQQVRTLRYVRSLSEPIPTPALPPGYTIRPIAGEAEVEALVALHRAAFDTERMTAAERLTWMRSPDYDPGLDLAAVAPDGSLAAYCFCAIYREENRLSGRNEGVTDPLATHPTHRGRGLAQALLCAGMSLLRARGAEIAALGTSSDNPAMRAAAEAVSYRVESERVWLSWGEDTAAFPIQQDA